MDVNAVDTEKQELSESKAETTTSSYFFYGTLMVPRILKQILRVPMYTTVCLTPDVIKGIKIMMRGPYHTLVPAPSNNIVKGKAYKVTCEAHEERMSYYETEAYKAQDVRISLEDGTEVAGKAFVWAGDIGKLDKGSFDESSFAWGLVS